MESEPPSLPLPSAPYRGIEPFRFVDQPIFSARTDEVRKLVRLITIYRGIFFYGESGAGKSSLINAGLIPALRDEGFAPERVRVQPIAGHELVVERIALTDEGTPPFLPSRFAASADKKTPEPARLVLSVEEFVRCIGKASMPQRQDGIATSGTVPVLFFDQFEELITLFEEAPDSREKFNQAREIQGRIVEMLLGFLGDPNLSIKLVLSFREDYLAKVSRRLAAAPQLGEQAFRLSFPPETVLWKIIRGPFESASIPAGHFTRRLSEPAFDALESSFKELSDTGTINLTEVQIACLALWENEEEEKAFLKEREHREAVRRLFGNYLDGALNRLPHSFRKPAITALTFLVTSSGTRNIVSENDLLGNVVRDDQLTQSDAREVLKALSSTTRLVFRQTRGDSAFYEISSEFLIPWIAEKRQARERDAQLEKQREEHERQQRELTQTQALLTEQRKRADDQAEAAKRQRKLTWAMGLVSVVALIAAVFSLLLRNAAVDAKRTAIQRTNEAEAAESRAKQQSKIAQTESLRVRKQNLDDKETIITMADTLLESTAPEEAATWHMWKSGALASLGRIPEAIVEVNAILEKDPENSARAALTYYYNTQGEPEKALAASDATLEKGYDDWIVYQNRAHTLGLLGRYKEGEEAFRKSNEKFTITGFESSEEHVSPDIQRATRRKILTDAELAVRAANYYGIANLRAYDGDATFPQALEEARKQPSSGDAALIALNWAWMHLEKCPKDYGALVAQAALWKQCQLPAWAKKYYTQFEQEHRQRADPRYDRLADWAGKRLQELQAVGEPVDDTLDAKTLWLEAMELLDRKDNEGALKRIKDAIVLDPGNVSFLLKREEINLARKDFVAVQQGCQEFLKKAPRSGFAHALRAKAMEELGFSDSDVEKQLRLAVEYDKTDADSMIDISDLVAEHDPKEALRWLERSRHISAVPVTLAWVYERIAKIQLKKKGFREASESIKTAIAIKCDEPQFYDDRREIELGISGKASETVVAHHLCEGYFQAGDTRLQLGRKAEALSLYWGSIERLAPLRKNERELDRDIAGAVSKISSVIESTGSRAKAAEFWKTAIESGRWNELRELFEDEEKRLSTAR